MLAGKTITGAWIDHAIGAIDADFAKAFRDLGMTEGAIMVNAMNATPSAPPWKLRATPAAIAKASDHLKRAGVDVILTCWPRPSLGQLAELERDMTPLLHSCGAVAIEVDCEANWDRRLLSGFASMAEAEKHLVKLLRRVAGPARRVEFDTYPFHEELNSAGPSVGISPFVDVVIPQAYSVNERNGNAVAYDSRLGPGTLQRVSMTRAKATGAPPSATKACGLAAYEQRFPGHQPIDAMREAIAAAKAEGAERLRWWSSKWIIGPMGSKWARQAITEASG